VWLCLAVFIPRTCPQRSSFYRFLDPHCTLCVVPFLASLPSSGTTAVPILALLVPRMCPPRACFYAFLHRQRNLCVVAAGTTCLLGGASAWLLSSLLRPQAYPPHGHFHSTSSPSCSAFITFQPRRGSPSVPSSTQRSSPPVTAYPRSGTLSACFLSLERVYPVLIASYPST
jgi:hypothetical protein